MDFKLQIHSNLFGVKCTSKVKGFKMIPQHDRGWCITVRTVPAHYDAFLSIKLHICVNANVWHSAARDGIGQLIDQTIK